MHAANLVHIRPIAYHEYSPFQLALGKPPNISHIRIFGCTIYVPIAPTHRTKMGPQRRLGIYVGYDSPSIIRSLEPSTGNVFTTRFANCHFNENLFPPLGGEKSVSEERREITWNASIMSHFDPRINQSELKVQRIIHFQNLTNQLPDAFIDTKKVTKSYVPVVNTPARINVPEGQLANVSQKRLKRGRPFGSKDTTPRKRRTQRHNANIEHNTYAKAYDEQGTPEEVHNKEVALEDAQIPKNSEISISYVNKGDKWDRNNIVINNIFAFQVALNIRRNDEDPEPQNVEECQNINDWPKWKEAMQTELNSLMKREVFGLVV